MKKIGLFTMITFLLLSCSKDQVEQEAANLEMHPSTRENNVSVCHQDEFGNYFVININENALAAHLRHGDAHLVDADGDGFVEAENDCVPGGDCDDLDASVYPGAEEICGDEIDNNCDGQVDEGCGETCPGYAWSDFLNSIDLTNACRYDDSYGVVIYSFGLQDNYCCGLYVEPSGYWVSGADNNYAFGDGPAESYDCFIQFLDDNNIQTCDFSGNLQSNNNTDIFINKTVNATRN